MELRKIDPGNVWSVVHLSVSEEQKNFVATNADSIIEAFAAREWGYTALPFALYEDDTPVGFVMIGYGTIGDEAEPAAAKDGYCIWRFMIDKRYQGRGLGRAGLEAVLRYIRSFPCGEAAWCWLSFEPENTVAKALYERFGFRETGEKDGDELVAALKL